MSADAWDIVHSYLGSYWGYRGEAGPDFFRLRRQAIELAGKYSRTDILLEAEGVRMEHDYKLLTLMDSELDRHIKNCEACH